MNSILTSIAALLLAVAGHPKDTIAEAVVVSSVKQSLKIPEVASPVTSVTLSGIEDKGISAPRDLSAIVPGLHIPDYGSAMTSSIYMRGLGSRIDNPVVSPYVDDVPGLYENKYDFQALVVRGVGGVRARV